MSKEYQWGWVKEWWRGNNRSGLKWRRKEGDSSANAFSSLLILERKTSEQTGDAVPDKAMVAWKKIQKRRKRERRVIEGPAYGETKGRKKSEKKGYNREAASVQ